MTTKLIVIDGPIGRYSFSKQFIRNELSGNSKNPVTAQISSLGGSVDHALNIYDQFISHGNVTAELSAFVASSATLIALGAQNTRMNENSFYLIHKAMNWVDEWGTMNEDQIEEVISKLEKQKQQLAKVTLQIAKMYAKKTSKSFEAILDLMKEETWLTAEEAMEWGFVDEVYAPESIQNYFEDHQMVAMITASGYPTPKRKETTQAPAQTNQEQEDSILNRLWAKFIAKTEEKFPKIKNKTSMKKHEMLNVVLDVDALESADNSVSLNEAQLDAIETELSTRAQAVTDAETAQSTAETERETAQNELATATASFDGIDATVAAAETPEAKILAIRTLLAKKPGTPAAGNALDIEDPAGNGIEEGVNWDAINALPHNKSVDNNS